MFETRSLRNVRWRRKKIKEYNNIFFFMIRDQNHCQYASDQTLTAYTGITILLTQH